jgi:hypothetical protein
MQNYNVRKKEEIVKIMSNIEEKKKLKNIIKVIGIILNKFIGYFFI